jgi:hypothetical protein
VGDIPTVRFEVGVKGANNQQYKYTLVLGESGGEASVKEERLVRLSDQRPIASFNKMSSPRSGSIPIVFGTLCAVTDIVVGTLVRRQNFGRSAGEVEWRFEIAVR